MPKIKRFIHIYQSNGRANLRTNNNSKSRHGETNSGKDQSDSPIDPIKVQDLSPMKLSQQQDTQSLESSLDVIATSCEVNHKSQNHEISTEIQLLNRSTQNCSKEVAGNGRKNTDRIHTITTECPVDTSLPEIVSNTARNLRKKLVSKKRANRKGNISGKPPLCIETNKKNSLYPDTASYKNGTANNKIMLLREHLTRSNTMSNPNLLQEEQAIIDSMFLDKNRQASRGRDVFSSAISYGLHKNKKKRRAVTKPSNTELARGAYSAIGSNKATQRAARGLNNSASKKIFKIKSKLNDST